LPQVVSLNTQHLPAAEAPAYLDKLSRALRAGRLSKAFPDRHALSPQLELMRRGVELGQYTGIFVDSRTGLPNMAAFTRVATDAEVAREFGEGVGEEDKRRYRRELLERDLQSIESHEVALRRHDAANGASSVRLDMTKLDASGLIIRVRVELTQTGSGGRKGVELDVEDKTASARDELHATIYRHAAYDAETLFVRLEELRNVEVERVERGVIGPALVQLPDGGRFPQELQGPLGKAAPNWKSPQGKLEMLLSFQSDFAARDLSEERSNDPLERLLIHRLEESEKPRYAELRRKTVFKVYKDRKFACTRGMMGLAKALCEAGETKNIIYPIR
jgi:hypothetical protein